MVNDLAVLVLDEDFGESVAKDASIVIEDLQSILPNGIGSRTVYYWNQTGRFEILLVSDGSFCGFTPCSLEQQTYLEDIFIPK